MRTNDPVEGPRGKLGRRVTDHSILTFMERASGDPYLEFGKQAKAIPPDGTKKSHKAERDRFKACVLAVQYGMQAESLAASIGSQAVVDHAMLGGELQTVFGWTVRVAGEANPRSLANFPMQANGAEMLRLASAMSTARGIRICAPVHDPLLIEAPLDTLDQEIERTQAIMAEASKIVLDGFTLRTDVEVVRYPNRYMDPRGEIMWNKVIALLDEAEAANRITGETPLGGLVLGSGAGSSILLS